MISEVVQTEAMEEQYLTFNLGENLVGIQLKVVEIIEFISELTPIPRAPEHVLGVANIENAIIPILDLEILLKQKTKSLNETVISIIIAIESAVFGIHIAEPPKVVLSENKINDPPIKISNNIPKDWIEGYFIDNLDNTVAILNPEKFWIGLGKSEITGPASSKSPKKVKKKSQTEGTSESKTQITEKKKISEAEQIEIVPSKEGSEKKSAKKKVAIKDEAKSVVKEIDELDVYLEDIEKMKSKKKKKGGKQESKTDDKKSDEEITPSDVVDDKKTQKKKTKDSEIDTKLSEEIKAPSDVVDDKKTKKKKIKSSENDTKQSEETQKSVKSKKAKNKDSNQNEIETTDLNENESPTL